MNAQKFKLTSVAVCVSSLLAGCGGLTEMRNGVDGSVAQAQLKIESAKATSPLADPKREGRGAYVERSSKPFLQSVSVHRPTGEKLPELVRKVTVNQPGNFNIQQAAQVIADSVGIPVTLSPDVLEDPNQNAQQNNVALGATGASANQMQNLAAQAMQASKFPIVLSYRDTPLELVLDSVCAVAGGLSHEFKDGRITIFRYMTRTYPLASPVGKFDTSMVIGRSSTMSTGTSGSASSTTTGTSNSNFSTSYEVKTNLMEELEKGIKTILSKQGKALVLPGAGTVTVTDGKRQVEEVGRLVEDINKVMTRQIYLRLTVLSLTTTDETESGVNWSAVLNKMNSNGNNQLFSMASPTGAVSTAAGSFGVKLIKQVNGNADWSGSSAIVSALKSEGKATVMNGWEGPAMNRRITPVAQIRNTAYIAQTTPATATAGGTGGVPGITPGTASYGFVLNVIPSITDRNSVVLEFGIDISSMNPMEKGTSGTGASQQTIDLPDIVAKQLLNAVALGTGDTLIVGGLEQTDDSYSTKTLGKDVSPGLGGMFKGKKERQSTIFLLTPVISNSGF